MNKSKNIEKLKNNIKRTDEQKQKYREANKRYRENMTDEQKQKLKDYRREYYKK